MKTYALLLALWAYLPAAGEAQAQRTKSSTDQEPCCNIIAINVAQATAVARDKAGKSFQFQVKDRALLKSLRVGQAVSADFATGQVTVSGIAPCCAIVRPAEPVGKPDLKPAEPCCSVTAIDTGTGIITATELATGRVFRFEVKDRALLTSVKIGQKVFADFGTSKVRIQGMEPCCNIIGHGGGRI